MVHLKSCWELGHGECHVDHVNNVYQLLPFRLPAGTGTVAKNHLGLFQLDHWGGLCRVSSGWKGPSVHLVVKITPTEIESDLALSRSLFFYLLRGCYTYSWVPTASLQLVHALERKENLSVYQLGVLGNFISWNPEIPQNCAHVSMHCVYRQCVCIYVCVYIERERWID